MTVDMIANFLSVCWLNVVALNGLFSASKTFVVIKFMTFNPLKFLHSFALDSSDDNCC